MTTIDGRFQNDVYISALKANELPIQRDPSRSLDPVHGERGIPPIKILGPEYLFVPTN